MIDIFFSVLYNTYFIQNPIVVIRETTTPATLEATVLTFSAGEEDRKRILGITDQWTYCTNVS